MTEEVEMVKGEFKDANNKSIAHLDNELIKLRVGKAMPNMLHGVMIDYYGSQTPITQVATISTMDARTLTVLPWEKGMLGEIARGIVNANLGFAPQDNGEMLIINVPPLTEDRRRDLVKKAKAEGEHAKVGVRNNRKDAMDFIKALKTDGLSEDLAKVAENQIQEITNEFVAKIDKLVDQKETDIMTL